MVNPQASSVRSRRVQPQQNHSAASESNSNDDDPQRTFPLSSPSSMSSPRKSSRAKPVRTSQSSVTEFVLIAFLLAVTGAVFFFNFPNQADASSTSLTRGASNGAAATSSHPENARSATPKAPVIAYAISLIECNGVTGAGFVDAAVVLRHSVHQNSIRNPASGSKYDYKMYAIVHKQAARCAPTLEMAGFEVLIRAPPLQPSQIKDEYLKRTIHRERCCGHDEFVKLYAYQLFDHKVVVHVDIDFIFHKPMDDVIDVMLGDRSKRSQLPLEGGFEMPDGDIEAMITKDWPSVNVAGRKAGFQAGFWVLKPSQKHFDALVKIVLEGNYVEGFSRENGWYGLGYGGFVGAMAMQGLVAYYYDIVVPGTWVELNHCKFNHIAAYTKVKGKCRNGQPECEQCQVTPAEEIFNIHYTACRKPWQCMAKGSRFPDAKNLNRKQVLNQGMVIVEHCMDLLKIWHGYRIDLENKLYKLTQDEGVMQAQVGSYNKDFFLGHCTQDQESGYLKLASGNEDTLKRIPELYQEEL